VAVLLAHALNNGADAVTSALLAAEVGLFAWFMHVRRRPERTWLRFTLPPVLVVVLVAAVTAGSWVPKSSSSSGALDTKARIEFVSPKAGETIHGSKLRVELRVIGGRVVSQTDTRLRRDAGHIHLFVDDRIVAMTGGLSEELSEVPPGDHWIKAEFVMANHRPWRDPVTTSVLVHVVPT
jgi:hypothetical protein